MLGWLERVYTNLWRPKKFGNSWFYPVDGYADTFKKLDYLDAYRIPEVNAVINLKARSFSNGIIKAVDKNGKELDKVPDFIKSPNWFQDQKEFMRQTKMFHEIFGDEYLYFLYPVGFGPERTKALYTIPPNLVEAEYKSNQPFFEHTDKPDVKYTLVSDGQESPIPSELIVHMNDNRAQVKKANDKHLLSGESKMAGLSPAINNLRMAYESRGYILKNRGALGILSNSTSDVAGAVPLDPNERARVQDEYKNYGTLSGQNHLIITNANLKWQKMGVNPSELGLYQETEQDFFKICDAYGTPIDLFGSVKGSTFENQKQAEKGLYLRTIIPEANEWIRGVSDFIGVPLVIDYSHLSVFQEDLKSRGDSLTSITNALSKMLVDGAITIEEYKEEIKKYGIGKQ